MSNRISKSGGYRIDPNEEKGFRAEARFRNQQIDYWERELWPAFAALPTNSHPPIPEVADHFYRLAPGLYGERPLPPVPLLLTRNNDFQPTFPTDPQPAIEVYAYRVAGGFQAKHPADVYIEDRPDYGAMGHHLENGSAIAGAMIFLKFEGGEK